ncbi:MAG: hypothetical protein WA172_00625 [Terriglobales bacterium]
MKSNPPRVACVEIGGIPISLSTCHERFADLLLQRYSGFLSLSRPEFALEFEIVDAAEGSDEDVCVRRDGHEWRIDRGDFSARWDPRTRTGQVRQNANPYSLDSVLRIVHSLILAERGGFLLHAASAICDGRAYLFSGVSGAGKTTITRLAPPGITLLTDEISYIRPDKDADIATYRAFGTPFSGELAKAGENCSAPVAALFFLEQGSENRIDEIPSAEAVRRLMRNILFFAGDPGLVANLLATACDIVARVPIRRLTFYPDSKVWDHIRQFEERQFKARQSEVGGRCSDGAGPALSGVEGPRPAGQSPATTHQSVGEPAHV